MRRCRVRAALAQLAVAACASATLARPAAAQSAEWLARVDYTLLWSGIAAADPRFTWQGRVALDADLVDYGSGRLTFGADYEAFLGGERRRYDLNQGTYRFEMTASRRTPGVEVAGLFQHVSRHLVDRENPPAVSWNTLGVRVGARLDRGRTTVRGRLDLARAMQQAYVDYAWTSDAAVSVRHALPAHRRVSLLAGATGAVVGVRRAQYGRPRVCGGRIEGGLRIDGARAAVEIFVGYERRLDAFPTDRFRVRMWTIGFRLASR